MDGSIAVAGLCSMEVVPKSLAGSAHGLACAVAQSKYCSVRINIVLQALLLVVRFQCLLCIGKFLWGKFSKPCPSYFVPKQIVALCMTPPISCMLVLLLCSDLQNRNP